MPQCQWIRYLISRRNVLEKIASHVGSFIVQAKHEDKLRQNQQDLNTLFNTIDDFLFILDMDGRIVYFNSIVTVRLGYKADELINEFILKVHPAEQYVEAFNKIQGMLMGTENISRVPLVCKNGLEIPVEMKVKKGKWGGKDAIISISRDSSERKSYEKQIRENVERLEMALLASDAGLWDQNLKTNELILNDKWCTMRGFEGGQQEFDSTTWKSLIHPDDAETTIKAYNAHLAGVTPFYQAEYRTQTKSGQYIWVLDTGKIMEYDHDGSPLRIVGTNIDISSKKENELILQQNLKQQELLSEIALELNSLEDFDTRIETILQRIGNNIGVSRVYVFEDSEDGLVTNNTYEWCNKNITPQRDGLQGLPYDEIPSWKSLLFKNGRVFSEDISELPQDLRAILEPQDIKSIVSYPLFAKGSFFGFIGFDECSRKKNWTKSELELLRTFSGIISNAYERKMMEKSIIDERDKANNANKAKSEFLANMSHEIRTPMNAILGFSEALFHKLDSAQHKKMLKSVLSSGNLLLSLLNDILDLSKIEAGKLDIIPQPIDLDNIIQEIKLLFNDKAKEKGIRINVFYDCEIKGFLVLDEIRIKQVIFNLVGNAIKFTHEGYVNLRIKYILRDKTGDLTIEVEDSGIGIPESQQELIFEAFRQQSGQSNRLYGGIGLGLAISKRLVEKMNGNITVKSKEGKGSTFTVFLPEVEISSTGSHRKESDDFIRSIEFDKANILIVDDVRLNSEAIENLISSDGFNITIAENGEAALELLETYEPDLILLDIRMPGKSGYEVSKEIKSNTRLSHIPVIAFTASVFSVDKIESAGTFDGFLIKPVTKTDLMLQFVKFLKYKLKSDVSQIEEIAKPEQVNFPDEIIKRLPEIGKALKETMLPKWEGIKDQLVLFMIEEFADELKQMAEHFRFQYLLDYSQRLGEDLEIVDLDAIRETLNEFPRIIEKIDSLTDHKLFKYE